MKLFLSVCLLAAACVTASPLGGPRNKDSSATDETPKDAPPKNGPPKPPPEPPVTFYLYTPKNPTKHQQIFKLSLESIEHSNFNKELPSRFIIHGSSSEHLSTFNLVVRDAWLNRGDFNVIVVDWAAARLEYQKAVAEVPRAGKRIAEMIDFLHKDIGMSLHDVHVIGHGMGAHVAGHAGKNLKSGQIHTIVGLDASLAYFDYDNVDARLNKNDAFYVESIQTTAGTHGYYEPIGKATFYPNGGIDQPECPDDVCSKTRAWQYYAEAVAENNFPAIQCSSYSKALAKNCGETYSAIRMGSSSNDYKASGVFYVPVHAESPYGARNTNLS